MARRPPPRKTPSRGTASRTSPPATPISPASEPERTAEVVLDVDIDESRAHLVLANCGNAVATDVQVEFSHPLTGPGGSFDLSRMPLFERLGVLRPGRTLRIFWDTTAALLADGDRVVSFVATVSWNERARPRQRAQYHHDLAIFRQVPVSVEPDRH